MKEVRDAAGRLPAKLGDIEGDVDEHESDR
jgi:hypothetical protein